MLWSLCSFLFVYFGYFKYLVGNCRKGRFTFFFACKFTFCGSKKCIAIKSREHPISLRFKVINFVLTVYNKGKRRRLHASDTKNLAVLSIL